MKVPFQSQPHPWWELADGWCVHVGINDNFGRCWNSRSGEISDFESIRQILYPETIGGDWNRIVRDALKNGVARE